MQNITLVHIRYDRTYTDILLQINYDKRSLEVHIHHDRIPLKTSSAHPI